MAASLIGGIAELWCLLWEEENLQSGYLKPLKLMRYQGRVYYWFFGLAWYKEQGWVKIKGGIQDESQFGWNRHRWDLWEADDRLVRTILVSGNFQDLTFLSFEFCPFLLSIQRSWISNISPKDNWLWDLRRVCIRVHVRVTETEGVRVLPVCFHVEYQAAPGYPIPLLQAFSIF